MVGAETEIAVNKANIEFLGEKISRLERMIENKSNETYEICEKILEQAKYTNGRVTKLERWQSYVGGAFATVASILAIFGVKIF